MISEKDKRWIKNNLYPFTVLLNTAKELVTKSLRPHNDAAFG